jgi:hypothetical protein
MMDFSGFKKDDEIKNAFATVQEWIDGKVLEKRINFQ